ncbi:MAG: hypothetical protein R3240_05060, partial [Gammaproteobacteria bacterium]|nr:hypothetical protein [Gammaproteobacteria bacterium]
MTLKRKTIHVFLTSFLWLLFTSIALAEENAVDHAAKQAVGFSGGWISGNGITYRRYFGKHFLQGTIFGVISNNGNNTYVNAALSGGTYLHKLKASGIIPPLGLKLMAGADVVMERNTEEQSASLGGGKISTRTLNEDMSYYGAGMGIDIGN